MVLTYGSAIGDATVIEGVSLPPERGRRQPPSAAVSRRQPPWPSGRGCREQQGVGRPAAAGDHAADLLDSA